MEQESKLSIDKKEMPEINNIKVNLEKLLSNKFLSKQPVTYDDVDKIINENFPSLDRENSDYPEKRDDRIVILRPGIEDFVKKFNEYKDEFKPEGQSEEYDAIKNIITDRAKDMLKYFIDFLSENCLEKLES
ncbi:hypothetical protein KAU09_02555 [Candidatus Parcubacteria bacterium]|nr:hypothetical protein [Candidatus Parcubacteria bacterium]